MTSTVHARRARSATLIASALASVLCAASALAQSSPATPARPATANPSIRAASALPSPVTAPVAPRPGMSPGAGPQRNAPPSAEEVFAAWDKDGNRSLSITEFRAGMEQLKQSSMVARLGGLFRSADANHNNRLEAGEYANLPLIKRAGKDAPPLATFDSNKDGALDSQEYLRMVEALVRTAETVGG